MKKEKLRKERNKGITLIALVITIIVLLILAGVTIATLTGENGILTRVNKAKTSNAEGEVKDEFALIANEWLIEKNANNKNLGDFLNEKLKEGKLTSIADNENGTYTIKLNGYQVIMNQRGEISDLFNPEEWDKNATPEEYFIWGSDNPENSGYGIVYGYTSEINNFTKIKYPSRCKEVRIGTYETMTEDPWESRSFTNNILEVELPGSVIKIGTSAFSDGSFKSLEKVSIPNSVYRIESSAFRDCTNITSLTIPKSVENLCSSAFYNTAWWNSQPDGIIYLDNVLCGCKGIYPNGDVEVEEGTRVIATQAFFNCTGLKSFKIPESVINIGENFFVGANNNNFKRIVVDNNNKYYMSENGILFNKDKTELIFYPAGKEEAEYVIPNTVTSIKERAFSYCYNLKNVIIPDSVVNIESCAFIRSTGISNIIIPSSVSTMGVNVFDHWTSSQTINCRNTGKPDGWANNWSGQRNPKIVWGYTGN